MLPNISSPAAKAADLGRDRDGDATNNKGVPNNYGTLIKGAINMGTIIPYRQSKEI